MTRGFSTDCTAEWYAPQPPSPPNKYSLLKERKNHIPIPYRHLSQLFSCRYNCNHGTKVSSEASVCSWKPGKNQPRNWSLVVGPISRFLARPSRQAPLITPHIPLPCHIVTGQSELNYTIPKDTILSAVPSSLHRSRLFQPLPRLALHVDAKMTTSGWEADTKMQYLSGKSVLAFLSLRF